MLRYLRKQLAYRKIRRAFAPRQEFVTQTRLLFLSKVRERAARAPVARLAIGRADAWRWALAGIGTIIILNTGAVALAEGFDVGAEHMLYGYKRAGEQLQMYVKSAREQAEFHHKFAQRRLAEIKELRAAGGDPKKIAQLTEDFKQEVSAALGTVRVARARRERFGSLCRSLVNLVTAQKQLIDTEGDAWKSFTTECAPYAPIETR